MYYYKVFDLVFAAEIEIPEFSDVAIKPAENHDVLIRFDKIAEKMPYPQKTGVSYQLARNALQLNVERIAKYLSINGNEIIIDPDSDANNDAVRSFLFDTPITGIMHQRGLLPLYGCAIRVKDHCLLFCGISGTGKSTLARGFMKRGYKVLTDDLAIIAERDNALVVLPGYPSQRLPLDVIKREKLDPENYPKIRDGINQRRVPIKKKNWTDEALPLKKIYVMTTWNKTEIELNEHEEGNIKFNLLHDSMHRQYLSGMSTGFALIKLTARLMSEMPLTQIIHTRVNKDIDKMMKIIMEDILK